MNILYVICLFLDQWIYNFANFYSLLPSEKVRRERRGASEPGEALAAPSLRRRTCYNQVRRAKNFEWLRHKSREMCLIFQDNLISREKRKVAQIFECQLLLDSFSLARWMETKPEIFIISRDNPFRAR